MKNISFIIFAFCFKLLLSSNKVEAQNASKVSDQTSSTSILNGSWKRIAVSVNGVAVVDPPSQFRVCHDGFFSIVGQDPAGDWKETYGGTYEISNNLYKEKLLYGSNKNMIGTTHWQEFEIKGDTIHFKLFKKLFDANGTEVPETRQREITCVRVR